MSCVYIIYTGKCDLSQYQLTPFARTETKLEVNADAPTMLFQSTLRASKETGRQVCSDDDKQISIHSPRKQRDHVWRVKYDDLKNFNPLSAQAERRLSPAVRFGDRVFQSTLRASRETG